MDNFVIEFSTFNQHGTIEVSNSSYQYAFNIFKKYITIQTHYVTLSHKADNGKLSQIAHYENN